MQLMKKLSLGFVVSSLFVCWGTKVFASAVVTISPSGSGSYALQGAGLAGVSAAKFTIAYDATTLANPRVTQGGLAAGAIMAANTNAPGAVIIAFIKHPGNISGDGTLATISFDPVGNAPGVIQSLAAELIDANGARIDAQVQGANPASPPVVDNSMNAATTGSAATGSQQTPPASAGSTPIRSLGGQLIMPPEEETAKERGRDEFSPGASPQKETSAAPGGVEGVTTQLSGDASAGVAPDRKNDTKAVVFRSVLDRFRSFNGVKTPEALSALFTQHETLGGIDQVPPIALSDGASPVRVSIRLAGTCKEAPSFNLLDAQLISLKVEGANAWAIELLPKKGTYQTEIRMLQCGSETEIPVTVAPPLSKEAAGTGGKLTEADFKRFLDESGTAKAPRFDLNGDGVRNYIDDFIFTANYLAQRGGKLK